MGPIPRLESGGFTDFTGSLSKTECRRIEKSRTHFHRHFPQIKIQIIISRLRQDFPVSVTLFWLFNLGGFGQEDQKLGKNRDVLIAVDPQKSQISLTTGYGLEPFLSNNAIDGILQDSTLFFQTGDIASGLEKLLESLSNHLAEICKDASRCLGQTPALPQKPVLTGVPDY